MQNLIYKTVIYSAAVIFCIYVFMEIGDELIIRVAMLVDGVSDRNLLDKESFAATISVYALLPEGICGFIGGWYLADWISEKIWGE